MNPVELFELIEKLKAAGVTHFKQGDLELTLTPSIPVKPIYTESVPLEKQATGEPDTEPPHIVQEMKSLLKLSDEDLIERLFPLPKPIEEEASA